MAEQAHFDLDVQFRHSGAQYQAQVVRSPAGDGQSVVFGRPFTDLELENLVLRFGWFKARTRRIEAAPVAAAKQAGGRLFDAVFNGPVGDCLRRSLDRARAVEATLRIRLRLTECPELADLPWELLYDSSDDWFLALSGQTPVVRYVQLPVQPRVMRVALPLRVLVIKSEAAGYDDLDLRSEWAQVAAALAELSDAGLVTFTELAAATLSELRRALLRETFHVLHYMGHGGFDAERGGVLLFTDRAGNAVPVTGGDLGVMLRDHTSLRMAVLNACEGARTDPADPFAGVADTLVRRGIPAVVAMQFAVSDLAAVEFAPALYGALAAGRAVDAAVAEGRKAMYTVSPLEWATPVLYLRADDAHLFDIAAAPAPGTGEPRAARPQHEPAAELAPVTATGTAQAPKEAETNPRAAEADRLYEQRRYAEAAAAYGAVISLDPQHARAHAGLGRSLTQLKQYEEAEAACREAVRLEPGLALGHAGLSFVLSRTHRNPEAEAQAREAVRLDPADSLARNVLGLALQGLNRNDEAEAAYREAIRLDPVFAGPHNNLGLLFHGQERDDEAEASYREAIRLDSALSLPHSNLGLLLHDLKRHDEAEASYREAIRLDPANALAYRNLSRLLVTLKRYNEAVAAAREAIRVHPGYVDAHVDLGFALDAQARYDEAAAAYRKAIRLDPANASAHFYLALTRHRQGRYSQAMTEYRRAIRLDPADALAYQNLGRILHYLKRYSEAAAAYQEAIRLDPAHATIHRDLGATLYKLGRRNEARAARLEADRLSAPGQS